MECKHHSYKIIFSTIILPYYSRNFKELRQNVGQVGESKYQEWLYNCRQEINTILYSIYDTKQLELQHDPLTQRFESTAKIGKVKYLSHFPLPASATVIFVSFLV